MGPVHVEWDEKAATTPRGQLPFFVDFLKKSGLFDAFVADCPLRYTSPNAPKRRDVLGTTMLSMLAGYNRYAHTSALRREYLRQIWMLQLFGRLKIRGVQRAFNRTLAEQG